MDQKRETCWRGAASCYLVSTFTSVLAKPWLATKMAQIEVGRHIYIYDKQDYETVHSERVLTPSLMGVAKYSHSVSSERTNAHSTTSSRPLRASSREETNLAPAYAIDSVAEPCVITKWTRLTKFDFQHGGNVGAADLRSRLWLRRPRYRRSVSSLSSGSSAPAAAASGEWVRQHKESRWVHSAKEWAGLTLGNKTEGVACEMTGTMVSPLWPPITGTLTCATLRSYKQCQGWAISYRRAATTTATNGKDNTRGSCALAMTIWQVWWL